MKRSKLRWLLGLWVLCAAGVSAKEYVIGVEQTDYYPVYAFRDGEYIGFAREVLDAFAKKNGHEFKYVALPIKRLFAEFVSKDSLDFKFPDHPSWQPDLKKGVEISYSAPLFESEEGGLVLPANRGKALGDLKTLGTIRGFTPWPYQDALAQGVVKLEESDDVDSLIQKALAARVGVVFVNRAIAEHHLREALKTPDALVFDPALPNNPVAYLLSTRKHPELVDQFDAFLHSESALLSELAAKYGLKK